jgi:hypothetical protein
LPEMKGKDLVSNFVRLCAVEIKFMHGCSVPWASQKKGKHSAPAEDGSVSASPTPPGSPEIQASQKTGALSSGEAEGIFTDEDNAENENDAYGEGNDHYGDRVVHFREHFDPENPLDIDWSDFKYPVPKHSIPRFREAHAIAAMFHSNDELAAKFPVLSGQINEGWQAHYKHPVHINDILQPLSTGENSYEVEEIEWLQKTVRQYV